MDELEWSTIPEFPAYEASACGQIRNRDSERRRKQKSRNCNGTGYLITPMLVNGRYVSRVIHRMVASAFLGPCPKGMEVNHKNGDKLDNRIINLEYITHQQNIQHHFDTRTIRDPRSKLTQQDVLAIIARLSTGVYQKTLATEFRVSQGVISRIARGKGHKYVKNLT